MADAQMMRRDDADSAYIIQKRHDADTAYTIYSDKDPVKRDDAVNLNFRSPAFLLFFYHTPTLSS